MALSSLTGQIGSLFSAVPQNDMTGAVYNPVATSLSINKRLSIGNSTNNNTAGGADEVFSFQQGITAGSSATIDFTAMTNLLQQASVSIARMKAAQIRLLSATDDSTISPAPNANSSITVTNFGVAQPCQFIFGNGGSGLTLNLTNNAGVINVATINVAGSNYPKSASFMVGINHINGTSAALSVVTNAGGVPTTINIVSGGSSYINSANTSTVVLGQAQINNGGFLPYGDPSAAGFTLVNTIMKNIKIINNDGTNAVTPEIDVFGGTT